MDIDSLRKEIHTSAICIDVDEFVFKSYVICVKTILSVLKVSIEYYQEFKVRYMHMIRKFFFKYKTTILSIGMDNRNDLLYYHYENENEMGINVII